MMQANETTWELNCRDEKMHSRERLALASHVLVTGDRLRSKELIEELRALGVAAEYYPNCHDVYYVVDATTLAVFFVKPLMKSNLQHGIRRFRAEVPFLDIPVFAVLPAAAKPRQVRSLFKAGATDVFKGHQCFGALPQLISEHMSLGSRGRGLTKQDRRLSRAIMVRLRVLAACGRGIKVSVREGRAFIMGRIGSFWKKNKVEEIVRATPGVTTCVSKSVVISISQDKDRELASAIRLKLSKKSGLKHGAIAVSVAAGKASLVGTVPSTRAMKRVLGVAESIAGVLDVDNLLTISREQSYRDSLIAGRIRKLLAGFFIHSPIDIAVVGDTAHLSGQVDMRGKKQLVENVVVDKFLPIKNVVNDIYIER